jgi:hypothetical protein
MKPKYTYNDIADAIDRLESMMNDGYIDIDDLYDDVEFHIIAEALKLYKEKLTKENDQS